LGRDSTKIFAQAHGGVNCRAPGKHPTPAMPG